MEKIEFNIIAYAKTCFTEKFTIPRQSGLAPTSWGEVHLLFPHNREEPLRGLDSFSHMILTFIPHQSKQASAFTVRPPRLGGKKRLGVFATRSPFRPNPICTSVVKIDRIDFENGIIYFSNHDLLNDTPILDIKPYIPMWDIIPEATNGWIKDFPEEKLEVSFNPTLVIEEKFKNLIVELISLNPAPRHQAQKKNFAFSLDEYEIKFTIINDKQVLVTDFFRRL